MGKMSLAVAVMKRDAVVARMDTLIAELGAVMGQPGAFTDYPAWRKTVTESTGLGWRGFVLGVKVNDALEAQARVTLGNPRDRAVLKDHPNWNALTASTKAPMPYDGDRGAPDELPPHAQDFVRMALVFTAFQSWVDRVNAEFKDTLVDITADG